MDSFRGNGFILDYPSNLSTALTSTFPKLDRLLNRPTTWAPLSFVVDPHAVLFSRPFRIVLIHPAEYNNTVRAKQEKLEETYRLKGVPLPPQLSYLVSVEAGWYDSRVNTDRIHVNLTVRSPMAALLWSDFPIIQLKMQHFMDVNTGNEHFLPLFLISIVLHELSHLLVYRSKIVSPTNPRSPLRREVGVHAEHTLFGGSVYFENSDGSDKVRVIVVN